MSKILIIEDNQEIRENLEEYLELSDFEVAIAPHGQAGIEEVRRERPDLILCDIAMPKMDGYEVLQQIRAETANSRIPFIFISASAQKQEIEKGKKAGADAYLCKPFSVQQLMQIMTELLEEQVSSS